MLTFILMSLGCATHMISGQVVDRNGEPVERAIVTVEPGGVQIVTDSEGYWEIDYLRDEYGERTRLDKRTDYTVEAFKVGYHPRDQDFYYKRGEYTAELLVLNEDSIRVIPEEQELDPDAYPDRTHSAGANYEGE
ncbi:MAG: carboxypeptidase-like regulatory domain-containing protein [Myxococcota bacterium]|nr:carboxypeptidase-like regulatory domain-containing protein [Myxococcota bacterium]